MLYKFLNSRSVKIAVVIIGILGSLAPLLDSGVLPKFIQQFIPWFSRGALLLVSIYLVLIIRPKSTLALLSYTYSADRYGIGYDSLEVECSIAKDGSATVRRKVTIKAYSEVTQLDTYLLIPERSPSGEPRDINFVRVQSLNPNWNVTLTGTKEELGRLSATIAISPPLSKGQSVIYEMIEKVPAGAFAIDLAKEELMKRETPDDYFGWNINRPTQKLALHVYFPEDTKPQVYGILVRYASASGFPADRPQYEEQRNLDRPIMTGPEGDRFVLKLKVEYPMIGLIYILYWRPVEKHRKVGISENLYQPQAKATGISPGTYGRLRTALLECGPFATDNELQAVFIDSRIQPWRHSLPKSDSTANRVQAVINFLYNKYSSSQENALVLFLRVLSEQIDAGDECRQRLIDLAQEIELERL